jgi:hypothetical protein
MWSSKVELDEQKSKNACLAQHNYIVCGAWLKSVIKMMWLVLSVFDWPIIMIGPGGLLLVVPHLFAVQLSGGDAQK